MCGDCVDVGRLVVVVDCAVFGEFCGGDCNDAAKEEADSVWAVFVFCVCGCVWVC